ncbi:uncharacterized protein LOC135978582 [Chrysemys picta bellii]|uniref:uncharacterized protein LOC135978582 n=1 Tax=Chrysemys picta bellii TaxID=8478 RepID=UPI0032B223CD
MTHGVTLKRCASLNPASLLPHENGQIVLHDCLQVLDQVSTPRPDLTDVPLPNPELELFVDGSAFVRNGVRHSGYAVTDGHAVIMGKPLSPGTSAQSAELQALTAACLYAKGKRVNIYTDSKYAFGVCHATGAIWKERGFITSSGSQIAPGKEIAQLLQAIQAPKDIAVIHCRAHTKGTDPVSTGNRFADEAAKAAALQSTQLDLSPPLLDWQRQAPDSEKLVLEKWGAKPNLTGIWECDNRFVLPKSHQSEVMEQVHKNTHLGANKMSQIILRQFISPGLHEVAKRIVEKCALCQQCNPKGVDKQAPPGGRKWAHRPMQHVQINFTDLPPSEGKEHLLVIIDQLTGWVEADPTGRATATTVCKILLNEIMPRFGPPEVIDSDQGTHFTAKVCKELTEAVGTKWAFHAPWHPQSSGQVERMNGTLKRLLTKLYQELNLKWTKVLPLALYIIRTTPNARTKLAPYEILFGHIPPTFAPLVSIPSDTEITKETEILLVSPTAIRVKELPTWIHHTRVKRSTAREPDRVKGSPEVDDIGLRGSTARSPHRELGGPEADNLSARDQWTATPLGNLKLRLQHKRP